MRISKILVGAVSLFALGACGPGVETDTQPELATTSKFLRVEKPVPGQYIVVLNDDTSNVRGLAQALLGGEDAIGHVYESALKGFSARMNEAQARALANNPAVRFVEEDGEVSIDATQTGATWGIDRIDQRALPLSGTYTYNYTGTGVNAYVIDTGILLTHSQFGGRAVKGYDAVTSGGTAVDCHGHGTHVAGTVGGSTYGVAKSVKLYAVRVLGCTGSGTNAGVIAGIDWVRLNHVKPAVANMSLGGSASSAVDTAVANAVAAGVTMVVAAGNSSANACNYSPARAASAITVGATTSTDARASYSNYGSCLDIFAPGSSVTSAWYSSTTATNTISGTSMASPHVAGAAALYLQANPSASPATVGSALRSKATAGVVGNAGTGSPNYLLYSL